MKFNPSSISINHPKRLVIIVISLLILAALATYGVFSYNHWREFDQNSQKAATSLKTSIDESLKADENTATASAQIDAIVSDFNKAYGENPCQVSVWYSWQTILPQLKTMRTTCDDRFKVALEVIGTLKPLSQYFKDEKKAADLFTTSLEATKAPTDYAAASSIWKSVAESTEFSTKDNFKAVKVKSIEVATAISAALAALATAVSNEDKAGFDAATTALQAAYAEIDVLKTTATTQRTDVIKLFIKAYDKL
jgi:predicted negative regulator of RcsB-dependent stress response